MVRVKEICVKKRGLLAVALITTIVSALTLFVRLGPDDIFYDEEDRYISKGPAIGVQFAYNKNLEKKDCQIPAGTPLSFWQTDKVLGVHLFYVTGAGDNHRAHHCEPGDIVAYRSTDVGYATDTETRATKQATTSRKEKARVKTAHELLQERIRAEQVEP